MSFLLKGIDTEIKYTLRFDGGCAPTNPGPCAGAYVIFDEKGKVIAEGGEFIEHGTNNYGEYSGLIYGLKKCMEMDIQSIHIEGDSLLVISQVCGKWKMKSENLRPLLEDVNYLLKKIKDVSLRHILREFNGYADGLCDKILKFKKSI
jgi:ribonuclease HI